MSFKSKISDAKLFKSLFEAIGVLIERSIVKIEPEKMYMRAMDVSRIAMCAMQLDRKAFDNWELTTPVQIELRVTELLKFLKRINADDSLQLIYDDASKKLKLILEGPSTARRQFDIKLIGSGNEEMPREPNITWNAESTIRSSIFSDAIKDAALVSESIKIIQNDDSLIVRAEGDMGEVEIDLANAITASKVQSAPQESMYAIEYLNDFFKAAGLSDTVTVSFSARMPINVRFDLSTKDGTPIGFLQYLLAPRVPEDD